MQPAAIKTVQLESLWYCQLNNNNAHSISMQTSSHLEKHFLGMVHAFPVLSLWMRQEFLLCK